MTCHRAAAAAAVAAEEEVAADMADIAGGTGCHSNPDVVVASCQDAYQALAQGPGKKACLGRHFPASRQM